MLRTVRLGLGTCARTDHLGEGHLKSTNSADLVIRHGQVQVPPPAPYIPIRYHLPLFVLPHSNHELQMSKMSVAGRRKLLCPDTRSGAIERAARARQSAECGSS